MKEQDAAHSFTEGPWKVVTQKEFIKPKTFEIRNHKGLLIANVNIGMSDAEQNANLIASAPYMLAELNDLKQKEGSIDNLWYTEEEIYHQLIRENYSDQIAKELSKKWADDLQGAFNKGYQKCTKELTRLRSELQQAKQEIANHIAVNSLLTDSDDDAELANVIYNLVCELNHAKSELQQERERVKELRDGLKIAVKYVSQGVDMFESASEAQHIKKEFQDVVNKLGLLIEKAKLNN